MRTYHRWLALVAGIVILWIAATGVVTQASRIYAAGEPRAPIAQGPTVQVPAAPRPPQTPLRKFTHFVTELHSGEAFGATGMWISLAAGLALIFFAVSGLYMYIELYRGRLVRARSGKPQSGGRYFWK
jgi:uncharacterized iron-regulated membrane protein